MINFCNQCGHKTIYKIPENDNRLRSVCTNETCAVIHYENPKVITGVLPLIYDDKANTLKVLLCRRAIEPRLGYWTLPAGFMENNENSHEGALRELHEESGAVSDVLQGRLLTIIDVPKVNQVHLFYISYLQKATCYITSESSEVQWFDFSENMIPWNDLAFDTVKQTLVYGLEMITGNKLTSQSEFVLHIPIKHYILNHDCSKK